MGLIKLKNIDIFDELNYAIKPANLINLNGSYLNDFERDIFRAKYVSNKLKLELENEE
jgi:protein-arginine kinase